MTQEQPKPKPGSTDVTSILIAQIPEMLKERQRIGIERYGRSLETFNGRDAFRDCTEELVDGLQYLKQAQIEHIHILDLLLEMTRAVREYQKCHYKLETLKCARDIGSTSWDARTNEYLEDFRRVNDWLNEVLLEAEAFDK